MSYKLQSFVVFFTFLKTGSKLSNSTDLGKISVQPHTIVKQICFPNGDVLFLSLLSISKNWMHNEIWGRAKISPKQLTSVDDLAQFPRKPNWVKFPYAYSPILHYAFSSWREITMKKTGHCHRENIFVSQWYGPVRKFLPRIGPNFARCASKHM